MELYIHIPFCERKCMYCDFLSFRTLPSVHEDYVKQLIREIRVQGSYCDDYRVDTVFIGGGTPSLLAPELMREIMGAVYESFDISPDSEITIEANPGTLLGNKLPVYHDSGINRVSLGLQSADNGELKGLGRIHTFEEFLKAFQAARMAGFSNINVDLMSGIPGQTVESWKNTLKKVVMLKPEHISAYSLILEEGTPFWEHYGPGKAAGDWTPLPDEDVENQLYHITRTFLESHGYGRYEISNYARAGRECRHNVGYWRGVSYLGVGLGASSYMAGCRFSNLKDLDAYLKLDISPERGLAVLEELHGVMKEQGRKTEMEEFMFLGLRMVQGISEEEFINRFGVRLDTVYGSVIPSLIENGLMKKEGVWYSLTEWGMDVSNYVLSGFLL